MNQPPSPNRNQFRPSFGMSPLYLAGRDEWIRAFQLGLFEPGNPIRASLVSGPRGIGKTVLLNEFEDTAAQYGWVVLRADPRPDMLRHLMNTVIPRAVLDPPPEHKRRLTGINIAGLGGINMSVEHISQPEPTLNTMLRDLLRSVDGVLITIDEVQSVPIEEMRELATTIQDLRRDDLNIAFSGAGLVQGINELLTHPGMTFLRRAETIQLNMVTDTDVARTLNETMNESGKHFDEESLAAATALTRGYPYLIQGVGSLLWAQAEIDHHSTISIDTVTKIHDDVIHRMGNQVHRPALAHLSERELDFLHHMAELGPEPASTAQIAERMGLKANVASQTRSKLLNRELIAVPVRGKVDFTLPYLREYLLSTT
ncbi:MAG: ATP-binding protein [Corynebacterium sp.]|nr:ATP-binding protein [Corynebacterium sp.]